LNGRRHTESSWSQYYNGKNIFVMVASYADKFGPLGKIAVVTGRTSEDSFEIDHWVMSCRAFSRRIEHACLLHLFRKFDPKDAVMHFLPTPRNGPLQNFVAEIVGIVPEATFSISKQQFLDKSPPVYLEIQETLA
jgi:predicted enzyme involved in methoxymalonyl-ACP biosynthesis